MSEGTDVITGCSYTPKGHPTLFWYVLYPNKVPQFLKIQTMEKQQNFEAKNIKEKNLAHCEIFSLGIRLHYVLLPSERHSAKDTVGSYSNPQGSRGHML